MKSWNQNCSHVSHKRRSLQRSFISMTAKESGIPGIAILLRILCLGMVPIWASPHFWQKTPEIAKQTSKVSGTTEPVMLGRSMRECFSQMVPLDLGHPKAVGSEPTSNNRVIVMMKWWIYFINSGILWHFGLVRLSNSFKIDSTRKISSKDLQSSHLRSVSDASFRCDQLQTLCFFEVWILWPLEGDSIWYEVQVQWGIWSI